MLCIPRIIAGSFFFLGVATTGPATAQRLPDGFYPESVAEAADGVIYVGSAIDASIVRIRRGATQAEPFVPLGSNGLMSVEGLLADDAQGRLYACTADLGVAKSAKTASALLAFDLRTGEPRGRWPLPGGGFCNDMAALNDGTLLISDTANPRILRFDPRDEDLSVWVKHPLLGGADFNGNGIALDGGFAYLTTFADGRLLRVPIRADGSAGEPEQVALPRPLAGADALRRLAPGVLLVFENDIAGGNGRVTQIDLRGVTPLLTAVADRLLEPTSGVIQRETLIVLESQFRKLFGPDKGKEPLPFRLQSVSLPSDISGRLALPNDIAFPNGIASSRDGELYVGSITSGRIWRRNSSGVWTQFFGGAESVYASTSLRLDERSGILWGASPDVAATLSSAIARQKRPSRIFAIDVRTGALVNSWVVPDGGFGNDIALDGRGGLYVTDSSNSVVRHLAADERTWSVVARLPAQGGNTLGPAGIVRLPSGDLIIGLFSEGAIIRIRHPGPHATVDRVPISRPIAHPDGMALMDEARLLLTSSASGEVLLLDPETGQIRSVVEGLQAPANVTVLGRTACVTELGMLNLAAFDPSKPENATPGVACFGLEAIR